MEFWEFLIQKEGDRSWLPLESSDVEILEGRYRIVARSSRVNTVVEVRIIHETITDLMPIRRVQKRSSRTNPDGLIVIFPYTRLLPGLWELRCTGDLMSEMMGDGWAYGVRLQVASIESLAESSDLWEPEAEQVAAGVELQSPYPYALTDSFSNAEQQVPPDRLIEPVAPPAALEAPDPEPEPVSAVQPEAQIDSERDASEPEPQPQLERVQSVRASAVFQDAEQQSEEVIAAVFQDALIQDVAPASDAVQPLRRSPAPVKLAAAASWLRLLLDQSTYVVQQGQPLLLTGQVETLDNGAASTAISRLRVRLYDPQNSQLLVDEQQPFGDRMPPFAFTHSVSLPASYQTYLLLGELVLYGLGSDGAAPVLAIQSFSVTTDLHELLEAIANDFAESETLPRLEVAVSNAQSAAEPDIPSPVTAASIQFQPAVSKPLPPQLHPGDANDPAKEPKAPELPGFMARTAEVLVPDAPGLDAPASAPTETIAAPEPLSIAVPEPTFDQGTDQWIDTEAMPDLAEAVRADFSAALPLEVTVGEAAVPEPLLELPQQDYLEDWADPSLDWESIEPRVPIWQRYKDNSIEPSTAPEDIAFRSLNLQERFWTRLQALAGEQSAWLTETDATADAPKATVSEPSSSPRPIGLDAELAAQEIVVDDEPPYRLSEEALPASWTLPADEPIPVPHLEITTHELTAGKPIALIAKLPNLMPRIFIKLWLRDRQTRSVLDNPRWLVDFTPDGFGNLIARTQLSVPQGCLEIQLEAIAVEMTTLRESNKVTLIRKIMPPDLSALSLDELDV